MMSDRVHVHVHLPESATGAADQERHEHVHLYLHLDESETQAEAGADASGRRRFPRAAALVAAFVLPIGAGIALSHYGSDAAPARIVAHVEDKPSDGIPTGFARQLAGPPNVTMPPGVPVPGTAPSGPAAFGLKN